MRIQPLEIGSGSGKTLATIGGAALVAFAGSRIGRNMDREDQRKSAHSMEDTGQSCSVTPKRTYEGMDGPCRDFDAARRPADH